jgi:hypothetical protein
MMNFAISKMKKRIIICLIIMFIATQTVQAETPKVVASIKVYSGRGTVEWDMTSPEITELTSRLQGLPTVNLQKVPVTDYVRITNYGDTSFPYSDAYIFKKGMVITENSSVQTFYLDGDGELMNWLLDLGNKHDPTYVAPKYKTLPENTPYMAFTPDSFEETISQGSQLNLRMTVFSEGNAPLEGLFETPGYVSANKKSFRMLPIEGIDDYTFSVDTTETGEKNGEIIIRTNDPSRSIVKIPFKVTVSEGTPGDGSSEDTQPGDSLGRGGANYFLYLVVLLVLAAVAVFVYAKKKAKN